MSLPTDPTNPKRAVHERMGFLLLATIASSALASLAFPPFELSFLGWCGLAPFLLALRQRGSAAAAQLGFLFGVLFCLGTFSWAQDLPSVSLSSFLVMFVIFCMYFLVFGVLYRIIASTTGSWIIIGCPALWVSLEYARSNLSFLSMPWNLLAHSQYQFLPVIQIADLTGVYGVSFLMVMVNQLLSEVADLLTKHPLSWKNRIGRFSEMGGVANTVLVAVAVGLSLGYGWYKLSLTPSQEHLRVALVQANILVRDKMPIAEQAEHMRIYERMTREAVREGPKLVVWPSSCLPAPIASSRLVRYSLARLARETGCYLVVGGAGHEKFGQRKEGYLPYSNSEFLIAPSGQLAGQYDKVKLIAFNEYLPLQGIVTWPEWITTLKESFAPGEKYTLFEVSGAKFGTPICWENMFPEVFRRFVKEGAKLMVSVTNEGFFGRTPAPYQSVATNVFRAVENRVSVVRSAPTGISAFIDPDGRIVERVRDGNGNDLFVPGVLVRDVPLANKRTFYTVHGDVFAYFAMAIAAFMVILSFTRHRRIKRNERT